VYRFSDVGFTEANKGVAHKLKPQDLLSELTGQGSAWYSRKDDNEDEFVRKYKPWRVRFHREAHQDTLNQETPEDRHMSNYWQEIAKDAHESGKPIAS
jgi:hypothetical protein